MQFDGRKDREKAMNHNEVMKEWEQFLRNYENVPIPNLDEFNQGTLKFQERIQEIKFLPEEEKRELCAYAINHVDRFQELLQIYIYSVLAYFFEGGSYAGKILELVRNSAILLEDNRFFVYQQLLAYSFRFADYLKPEDGRKLRMMYREIYHSYRNKLGIVPAVVPEAQRNPKIVVFLISQYLNEQHGPTKTVLDRCEVIADKMGATPVIINTAELCAAIGYIPYFLPLFGNYRKELQNVRQVEYHGRQFPYIQCSENMPNPEEMAGVVQTVKQLNPYCVIQIGGSSICADLCSNYYPVITVATVPSGIMTSEGQFLLKGSPITETDLQYIRELGFSDQYLQYGMFTWSFKPQTTKASRKQFGIPEDACTVIIVGARLDFEVDERFIEEVLLPVMEHGIVPVFVGKFNFYSKRAEQYPLLGERSVYTGFVDDILAVNEICDIYVNPGRNGGGTSVVEAMAKKLPPVSLDYGDVALGAGEEFCVKDYPEMVRRIIRLQEDSDYYAEMSEKAYRRMQYVTDSQTIFWDVFQKIRSLPEFHGEFKENSK